jgi:hypothetical protein
MEHINHQNIYRESLDKQLLLELMGDVINIFDETKAHFNDPATNVKMIISDIIRTFKTKEEMIEYMEKIKQFEFYEIDFTRFFHFGEILIQDKHGKKAKI